MLLERIIGWMLHILPEHDKYILYIKNMLYSILRASKVDYPRFCNSFEPLSVYLADTKCSSLDFFQLAPVVIYVADRSIVIILVCYSSSKGIILNSFELKVYI